MVFSVGIGLTNECNLRCPHCYRPDTVVQRLTLRDVQQVCESIPARSVNLGVGENGLHTEYRAILDYLGTRALKTSITSNGLSIEALDDDAVKRFHSVELSLDFPTERDHDAFRGAGNWRTVMGALERCVALGVPVTVTSVMMSINYDRLADLARLAAGFGAHLRVNIYQPAKTDRFTLTYEQFWRGVRLLSGATRLVATTEPVLAAVLGAPDFTGPGCGRSTVRVAPDGRVLPCTYWPASRLTLTDLARLGGAIVETAEFVEARQVPAACRDCPCRGGCAGRRALAGRLDAPDPYCPFARGERITLDWERTKREDLPKMASACTTVVSAR
ncbi:MAG: radical SAM protein [Candidatus Rokuibacteriota bacterium]|nr:MAG: radical SAM protein [Candidatus Rokubacteria bacterium]